MHRFYSQMRNTVHKRVQTYKRVRYFWSTLRFGNEPFGLIGQ